MTTTITSLTPFIPSDKALGHSPLPDKAVGLQAKSAGLMGQLAPLTLATIEQHMEVINSYYSNKIEGNPTRPHEIRAAAQGHYSSDAKARDLQEESLAHMAVQRWSREQKPTLDTVFSPDFILQLHQQFYEGIPERLWVVTDASGNTLDKVIPGQWRTRSVEVGQHIAPEADKVASLMERFCEEYHPQRFKGDRKLIAIMAAHHRLVWIHPFLDGNGRVARLWTDAALRAVGLGSYGAWCLSRGLARSADQYKLLLHGADSPRQGDYDGRGALSEQGLLKVCDYLLDVAIDQVTYMSGLLELGGMRERIQSYVHARNDRRVPSEQTLGELKPSAVLVLYSAFIHGEISRAHSLELCAMPERSARRLLSQLKADGLLSETSSRSPLRWEIPEHAEPWYFPQLAPLV